MRLTVNGTALVMKNLTLQSKRLPDIKNARSVYLTPARNRQRNNNRKQAMSQNLSPSQLDPTAQRILSARQHKISDQNNVINDLKKQIDYLKTENKTLKSQSYRQEKALNKIETRTTDLPQILEHHEAEVSNLREQIRRSKDALNCEIRQRKDIENEASRLRMALTKAQSLVNDKNLGERNILQIQLKEAIEKLEVSENSLKNLQRHLDNLDKTHKREIYNLKKQNKQYQTHCQNLEEEVKTLKLNLKEKEKLLEIQNIYSHKIKMPHRLPGSSGEQKCTICSNIGCHDKHLDKLNFINFTEASNRTMFEYTDNTNSIKEETSSYLDPEKIKSDIRKILEEEIMSGRIKPVQYIDGENGQKTFNIEYQTKDHDKDSQSTLENNDLTSIGDNNTTPRSIGSSEKENLNHEDAQSIKESQIVSKDPQDFEQNNISIKIERKPSSDQDDSKDNLKYSYPITDQIHDDDLNPSDIETISTIDLKPTSVNNKTYKFNDVVENLHNGVPVPNDSVKLARRRQSNNSMASDELVAKDTNALLPPLTEEERQHREKQLMSELFGGDYSPQLVVHGRPFPHGIHRTKSNNSLLWEQEAQQKIQNFESASIDSTNSEGLEKIII